MRSKTLWLITPILVALTQVASATVQIEAVGSVKLGSLSESWTMRNVNWSILRTAPICVTGTFAWWDPPSNNSVVLPLTCADQDSYTHAWINGSAIPDGADCNADSDTFSFSTGLSSPLFSLFEPLTLDLRIGPVFAEGDIGDATNASGEVPAKLTPLSGSEAARRLSRAWQQATRRVPSPDTLRILTAHFAHETRGGVLMYNYNFGGIKGRSPEGHSCIREAREGWGLRTQARLDRFRVYPNAQQGAADYLSLLTRLYPAAIDAADRGDVREFVAALKGGGYFTGSEEAYAHSLSELFERALQWGFDAVRTNANSAAATAVNDRF